MSENMDKKHIRVDRLDLFIQRFRENIKLQDHLEQKRKSTGFANVFRKIVKGP